MRNFLQFAESQKPAAAFDGMNRAKNARQKFLRSWVGLQLDQFAIQTVQILIAFDQKIANQIVHCTTLSAPANSSKCQDCAAFSCIPRNLAYTLERVFYLNRRLARLSCSSSSIPRICFRRKLNLERVKRTPACEQAAYPWITSQSEWS